MTSVGSIYLFHLMTGISVRLHRPELEENIQSQAEHEAEER